MPRKYNFPLSPSAGEANLLLLTQKGEAQPMYSHSSAWVPGDQEVLQEVLPGGGAALGPRAHSALSRKQGVLILPRAVCYYWVPNLAFWLWTPAGL